MVSKPNQYTPKGIFNDFTFHIQRIEKEKFHRLKNENGGRFNADPCASRVTHILVDVPTAPNEYIDLSSYQSMNRKSYRDLAQGGSWTMEDLLNTFARRMGDQEGPKPGKTVLRVEWVEMCVEKGTAFRINNYLGQEVLVTVGNQAAQQDDKPQLPERVFDPAPDRLPQAPILFATSRLGRALAAGSPIGLAPQASHPGVRQAPPPNWPPTRSPDLPSATSAFRTLSSLEPDRLTLSSRAHGEGVHLSWQSHREAFESKARHSRRAEVERMAVGPKPSLAEAPGMDSVRYKIGLSGASRSSKQRSIPPPPTAPAPGLPEAPMPRESTSTKPSAPTHVRAPPSGAAIPTISPSGRGSVQSALGVATGHPATSSGSATSTGRGQLRPTAVGTSSANATSATPTSRALPTAVPAAASPTAAATRGSNTILPSGQVRASPTVAPIPTISPSGRGSVLSALRAATGQSATSSGSATSAGQGHPRVSAAVPAGAGKAETTPVRRIPPAPAPTTPASQSRVATSGPAHAVTAVSASSQTARPAVVTAITTAAQPSIPSAPPAPSSVPVAAAKALPALPFTKSAESAKPPPLARAAAVPPASATAPITATSLTQPTVVAAAASRIAPLPPSSRSAVTVDIPPSAPSVPLHPRPSAAPAPVAPSSSGPRSGPKMPLVSATAPAAPSAPAGIIAPLASPVAPAPAPPAVGVATPASIQPAQARVPFPADASAPASTRAAGPSSSSAKPPTGPKWVTEPTSKAPVAAPLRIIKLEPIERRPTSSPSVDSARSLPAPLAKEVPVVAATGTVVKAEPEDEAPVSPVPAQPSESARERRSLTPNSILDKIPDPSLTTGTTSVAATTKATPSAIGNSSGSSLTTPEKPARKSVAKALPAIVLKPGDKGAKDQPIMIDSSDDEDHVPLRSVKRVAGKEQEARKGKARGIEKAKEKEKEKEEEKETEKTKEKGKEKEGKWPSQPGNESAAALAKSTAAVSARPLPIIPAKSSSAASSSISKAISKPPQQASSAASSSTRSATAPSRPSTIAGAAKAKAAPPAGAKAKPPASNVAKIKTKAPAPPVIKHKSGVDRSQPTVEIPQPIFSRQSSSTKRPSSPRPESRAAVSDVAAGKRRKVSHRVEDDSSGDDDVPLSRRGKSGDGIGGRVSLDAPRGGTGAERTHSAGPSAPPVRASAPDRANGTPDARYPSPASTLVSGTKRSGGASLEPSAPPAPVPELRDRPIFLNSWGDAVKFHVVPSEMDMSFLMEDVIKRHGGELVNITDAQFVILPLVPGPSVITALSELLSPEAIAACQGKLLVSYTYIRDSKKWETMLRVDGYKVELIVARATPPREEVVEQVNERDAGRMRGMGHALRTPDSIGEAPELDQSGSSRLAAKRPREPTEETSDLSDLSSSAEGEESGSEEEEEVGAESESEWSGAENPLAFNTRSHKVKETEEGRVLRKRGKPRRKKQKVEPPKQGGEIRRLSRDDRRDYTWLQEKFVGWDLKGSRGTFLEDLHKEDPKRNWYDLFKKYRERFEDEVPKLKVKARPNARLRKVT